MSTIVLLHGAYQGGWIWTKVAAELRKAGHLVLAPTLDGCGERKHTLRAGITTETQAAEIAELLFYEDLRDVVMVGTSCGGMVMAAAAERARDRIARLVFADALALMDGEKLPDIVKRPTAINTEFGTGQSKTDFENRLFAEFDPAMRAWAVERCTQHPIATMTEPVRLPTFWSQSWKAKVIWCKRSVNPPVAHQRRCAETLKASWHELDTGHYPMLSEPQALAGLIATG